jgi:hypothetical protein
MQRILINVLYVNNKNFVHQVGNQPRLYCDARSTSHQGKVRSSMDALRYVRLCYKCGRVFVEEWLLNLCFICDRDVTV